MRPLEGPCVGRVLSSQGGIAPQQLGFKASPRSRTTHCKTWAFSARLSFERSVSTSRSGLMMRHTPGEAVHMLETSRITLHHQESSSIEPCRRSRHLSQSPFEFFTTDGFLAPTLLNQLPELRAAP